jgi:GTP-binding protein
MTAADEQVAEILRRSRKPVFVAANKAESARRRDEAVEFYALGLGEGEDEHTTYPHNLVDATPPGVVLRHGRLAFGDEDYARLSIALIMLSFMPLMRLFPSEVLNAAKISKFGSWQKLRRSA